ncbi:hypothetical protein SLA2020_453510 [Shorea laevis]
MHRHPWADTGRKTRKARGRGGAGAGGRRGAGEGASLCAKWKKRSFVLVRNLHKMRECREAKQRGEEGGRERTTRKARSTGNEEKRAGREPSKAEKGGNQGAREGERKKGGEGEKKEGTEGEKGGEHKASREEEKRNKLPVLSNSVKQ